MRQVRLRMAAGAARLISERGVARTSFTEVLELTSAPRGSIYHHFPGGKDELVVAALQVAEQRVLAALSEPGGGGGGEGVNASADGDGPADVAVRVTEAFVGHWRAVLAGSGYRAGCPVMAVTTELAGEAEAGARAGEVVRSWQGRIVTVLVSGGVPRARAEAFAVLLVAAVEGAVLLSRAERSGAPLDAVHAQLLEVARALGAGTA